MFKSLLMLGIASSTGVLYWTDLGAEPLDICSAATEFVVARTPGRALSGIAGI